VTRNGGRTALQPQGGEVGNSEAGGRDRVGAGFLDWRPRTFPALSTTNLDDFSGRSYLVQRVRLLNLPITPILLNRAGEKKQKPLLWPGFFFSIGKRLPVNRRLVHIIFAALINTFHRTGILSPGRITIQFYGRSSSAGAQLSWHSADVHVAEGQIALISFSNRSASANDGNTPSSKLRKENGRMTITIAVLKKLSIASADSRAMVIDSSSSAAVGGDFPSLL